MYSFVRSYAISRSIGSQWSEIDLSKSLLSSIYSVFSKAYVIIYDSLIEQEVIVDIEFFKNRYSGMNLNLEEVLDRHTGLPLVTTDELPNMNIKHAIYSIRNKAGYRYSFAKIGFQYPDEFNSKFLPDVKITRPGYDTDMKLLNSHCLITVNGYVHDTDANSSECYVLGASKTIEISKDDRIGILSFLDVGELVKYKLSRDNIHPFRIDGDLKDKIIFKVDEDIEDDSFMLVLGGYLIFPQEGIFYRQGSDSFVLDINKIPYLERILECREFIDISSLNLDMNINEDGNIEISNLYSNDVIKNYLCMDKSFLVRIKTDNLNIRKFAVKRVNTPGHFVLLEAPKYPMFVGYGRMVEYWYQKQGERYLVSVADSYFRNYSIRYRKKEKEQVIGDGLMAQNPIYHQGAVMLEISSYV